MDAQALAVAGIGAVTTILGASGGLWAWLSERAKSRAIVAQAHEDARAKIAASEAGMSAATNANFMALLREVQKDRRGLRAVTKRQDRDIDKLTRSHAELNRKVEACEERHTDCEGRVTGLQDQVAKLMRENPPAGYLIVGGGGGGGGASGGGA